jgi:type VI secretion system secreted protein VgrG
MMDMANNEFLTRINASESQYHIDVKGLAHGLLSVASFESVSDQLCDDYCFTITVHSTERLSGDNLTGKEATLTLLWSLTDKRVTGIISHWQTIGQTHQGFSYRLSLSSHFYLLKNSYNNRVFTDTPVQDIIKTVFENAGFPMTYLSMKASGATLDMLVQYDESDHDFVTRIMRKSGFVYAVVEHDQGPIFTVCNNSRDLARQMDSIALRYQAPTGQVKANETIFSINAKAQLLTNSHNLDDYNYQASGKLNVSSKNQSQVAGFGEDNRYGEHYKTSAEGKVLAQIRQDSIDCQRECLLISSDCRAIRPGVLVIIEDSDIYNGSYMVTEVAHQGSQAAGLAYGDNITHLSYKNQARLVASKVCFKAPIPQNKRVFTSFNATISQEVDELGRYKVDLPFAQAGENQQSKSIRLMQPYGGAGHGMHFPLSLGCEVVICGINGDLDRLVILGALYNTQSPSPVTKHNQSQNKLVTRAGHTLLMDDKVGHERISLGTLNNDNALVLDATNGAHQASLASKEGKLKLSAQRNISFSAGADHQITAGGELSMLVQESIKVQTRAGDININSAQQFSAQAAFDLSLEASDGNATLCAEQQMKIEAGQDISLYAQEGNLTLLAEQADLSITSGANITIKSSNQGSIRLSQGQALVEIDAAGNLSIEANNITLSAKNIRIKGNALTNN